MANDVDQSVRTATDPCGETGKAAREVEADESHDAMERAFEQVVKPKKGGDKPDRTKQR